MMHKGSDPTVDSLQRRRALLSHATLLRGGSPLELDSLARHTELHAHPSGTLLVAQDAPADAVYFIAYGRVRLAVLGDSGRELTVGELERGDCFGESAILADARHTASAIAAEDVLLLAVPRDAFIGYAQARPATAFRLAVEQTRRLATANQQLGEVTMHNVELRVARTLRRLAARDGEPVSSGVVIRRRVTHQELAQMIGTCRETVTRSVAVLMRRGLVIAQHGKIVVTPTLLAMP